jgi:hypothetical protein
MIIIAFILTAATFYRLGQCSILFSEDYEAIDDDAETYREMMDSQKDYEHE